MIEVQISIKAESYEFMIQPSGSALAPKIDTHLIRMHEFWQLILIQFLTIIILRIHISTIFLPYSNYPTAIITHYNGIRDII